MKVGSALLHWCVLTTHMQKLLPCNRYTLYEHTSLRHTTHIHHDLNYFERDTRSCESRDVKACRSFWGVNSDRLACSIHKCIKVPAIQSFSITRWLVTGSLPEHMCNVMQDIQAEKLQRPAGQAAAKAGGVPASTKVSLRQCSPTHYHSC